MVDVELNELRKVFLDEARQKVSEMQSALDDGSGDALERVTYLAHQLKGSGGSYGYQRISADAEALEQALEKQAGDEQVRAHLASLQNVIDQCARELD